MNRYVKVRKDMLCYVMLREDKRRYDKICYEVFAHIFAYIQNRINVRVYFRMFFRTYSRIFKGGTR